MNKEDIEFLKDLQREIKTQDDDCQADPRFWVVGETKRQWGISPDFAEGSALIDGDEGGAVAESIEEAIKYIQENNEDYFDNKFSDEDFEYIFDIDELVTLLELKGFDTYSCNYYRDEHTVVEDTFFLTKRACKQHIKLNDYHYNKPHTYAMTAWRSPEYERFIAIFKSMNLDEIEVK